MRPTQLDTISFLKANSDDHGLIHDCNVHQFEVFSEVGYRGTGPVITEVSDLPSLYYVALEGNLVVGCVRVVTPSPVGFPTLNCMELWQGWAEATIAIAQTKRCEEILFSTVRKGYRKLGGAAVILNLYRILVADTRRRGVEYWFTSIDEKLYPYFTSGFNFKFEQIGDPQDYLGAPVIPCIMRVEEGLAKLRENDPELADFIESAS